MQSRSFPAAPQPGVMEHACIQVQLSNTDGKTFQFGWSDVSYVALVEMIGKHVHVVPGRPLYTISVHCPQENMKKRTWNICFVGNYDN